MGDSKPKALNFYDFMPAEEAEDYTWGSVALLEKFGLLLAHQVVLLDQVPASTGSERLVLAGPLLMGISSNASAAVRLARLNFGNEVYAILRSLVERIVTFHYLQCCPDEDAQNYHDYFLQKTYRKFSQEISINDKKFAIRSTIAPDLEHESNENLKRAVEKFTGSTSGNPITRWSNTSIAKKLSVIDEMGKVSIRLMAWALLIFYDDGSEALHGTLYGCVFHLGVHRTGKDWRDADRIRSHHHDQMITAFFVFTLLLGELLVAIPTGAEKSDLASQARDANAQARDMMTRAMAEKGGKGAAQESDIGGMSWLATYSDPHKD